MEVTVRDASFSDAERLVQIYGHYVEHTAISFEYERPSPDDFRGRCWGPWPQTPKTSLKKGATVSFAESRGLSTGQATAMSGSFQRMPASSLGQ